mmetsp:Transcript_13164/g.16032  ORF Transcript_13164/g.16032 Transcript_13164/m.16032 type:complete len:265 (+) Transcript_13164:500-1294(+)
MMEDGQQGTNEEGTMMDSKHQYPAKTKYNLAYESKLLQKWNHYFQQLVDYKNQNGHSNFPTMNGSLGRWISRQRTLYRSKKIKPDRLEKLKSIEFAFEDATALEFKGKLDQQWENMFQLLIEHKVKTGHCFDVPEDRPLGKWLYRQRWLYRHGNLREDRAAKLLDVGFEEKKVLKKDSESGRKRKRKKTEDSLEKSVEDAAVEQQDKNLQDESGNQQDTEMVFDQIQMIGDEIQGHTPEESIPGQIPSVQGLIVEESVQGFSPH